MDDLIQCAIARDDLRQWLEIGHAPLTICQGGKAAVTLTRLEKCRSIDYLYQMDITQSGDISWNQSLTFCGVYDARSGALYLAKDAMKPFTEGAYPFITEAGPSVLRELRGKINRRVENIISRDEPDGPAHGCFTMDHLPEAAFMAYLQDPESFLQTEAERYIQSHQEDPSPQFLKNGALPAEHQALARDAGYTMTIGGMNR